MEWRKNERSFFALPPRTHPSFAKEKRTEQQARREKVSKWTCCNAPSVVKFDGEKIIRKKLLGVNVRSKTIGEVKVQLNTITEKIRKW